jgi:hypothetical protein
MESSSLVAALMAKFRSPAEALEALGLDPLLLTGGSLMALDTHYDRRRDADDRRHYGDDRHARARDALRRAADAAEPDDEVIEELLEALGATHPEVVGRAAREIAEDGRGPYGWARDRRERRRAEDVLHHRRARDVGRRPHLGRDYGPPGVGREEGSPRVEEFAGGRRHWEEGEDRRRAHDMGMDAGGDRDLAHYIFGDQGLASERMGVIR